MNCPTVPSRQPHVGHVMDDVANIKDVASKSVKYGLGD